MKPGFAKQTKAIRRSSDRTSKLTSRERPSAEMVEGVILVTRYRFEKFREAFDRNPGPKEPLFFVESLPHPVLVSDEELLVQISEAAKATGVDLRKLKIWLKLL